MGRRDLASTEHVNLQVALDAWSTEPGRDTALHGLAMPPHFGPLGLQMLLHGDGLPPVRLSAPDPVELPTGPDRTLACLRIGLLLVEETLGRSWLPEEVLSEEVLRRVERHSLDMADRREQLRSAGQHLKGGLLLH